MNSGFWTKLQKPIMALAPMADVTDAAFRFIIAKYSKYGGQNILDESGKFIRPSFAKQNLGGPDVMFTEFVSADGLCHKEGRKKLLIDLSYTEAERPIVAQLFTGHPDKMYEAAKLVADLGFDGLDINMGCPDRKVEKQCAGAALMKNPKLAREIIRAARFGAPRLPISVKTRLGYNKNEIETWLPELLFEEPAAVIIHARTRKEMSDVPAHWEWIAEAVKLRDRLGSRTLILGNGDVKDLEDGRAKARRSGADGIALGRSIFGRPELFSNSHELENSSVVAVKSRLSMMVEHAKLFEKLFCGRKNFAVMKKHFKAYVRGWDGLPAPCLARQVGLSAAPACVEQAGGPGLAAQAGAKELSLKLMRTLTAKEVEAIVAEHCNSARE